MSVQTVKTTFFEIDNIPAVIYGEASDHIWLFIHGKCGRKEEAADFAEIVCSKGFQVLAVDLPQHGARKGRMESFDPWTAVPELCTVMNYAKEHWNSMSLRANSIGAYFSMLAFEDAEKALLVSPIVDMERLILNMMVWSGVTEAQLKRQREIITDFGETLSWEYLCYVREHTVHNWHFPIAVLYGGHDNLTAMADIEHFAARHNAALTVMDNGEHWFHTSEQLAVLRSWETKNL